jgi:hypothetical protein
MTMLQIDYQRHNSNSPELAAKRPQRAISATLCGDNRCECEEFGTRVTANAPVLALCRQLLAQGVDPDRAVAVYRCGVLALKVRSIREAARLTVKIAGNGTPIFTLGGGQEGAAAPPVRFQPDFDPTEGPRS